MMNVAESGFKSNSYVLLFVTNFELKNFYKFTFVTATSLLLG